MKKRDEFCEISYWVHWCFMIWVNPFMAEEVDASLLTVQFKSPCVVLWTCCLSCALWHSSAAVTLTTHTHTHLVSYTLALTRTRFFGRCGEEEEVAFTEPTAERRRGPPTKKHEEPVTLSSDSDAESTSSSIEEIDQMPATVSHRIRTRVDELLCSLARMRRPDAASQATYHL